MAKLNGPLGSKLRGKVGEVVAAKTVGGATAIRAYQPVVKNPKTNRQLCSRSRFAHTSTLASLFAEAIGIGCRNAAGAAGIYPRNVWVRAAVKGKKYVTMQGASFDEYDLSELEVSMKSGINVAPELSYNASTHKVTATNAADVTLAAGQSLGLVVVSYLVISGEVRVLGTMVNTASAGVELPAMAYSAGVATQYCGFFVIVEPTGNDIASDTIPWKYPSATSATSAVYSTPE